MTQNDKKFIEQSQRGGITLANGARYQHLVAVWLLVCEAVESIALETENDIAYPPGDKFSVYVQVKHRADDQMWNSTSLTASDENIFRLFRINAEKNPEAELWFVTDTAVDTSPLDELKAELYANNPNAKNRDVMKRLQAQGLEASPKTAQLIDRLVIKKLMTYEFLTVAIERTLLAQGFAPDRTFGILNGMVGFTLEIGRQLNLSDRVLSRIELYQKCVGISPPQAFTFAELLGYCNQMVSRVRQERPQTAWNEAVFVSRESFVETFELFTQSPDPLFVLAGESGRGKSFICSWLAEEYLKGCLRVLWNAADLTPDKPILNALIEELNPRVDVQQDAPRWLERLSGYAATMGKPFFILIDEINRADDVRNFKNILLQAVREIEGHNLKLFVTCRTQAWDSLAQETDFQRYVFAQQPSDELGEISEDESQEQSQTSAGVMGSSACGFRAQQPRISFSKPPRKACPIFSSSKKRQNTSICAVRC